MDIWFLNSRLAKLFNSEIELQKKYGSKLSKTIMRRLEVIASAECLEDIPANPPFRRHQLRGTRKGEFAVDLDQRYRLILLPRDDPAPTKADGGLDLKRITAVTIVGVEDYH